MATRTRSFYDVLAAAIRDIEVHGFDSEERLAYWQRRLAEAAETSLVPREKLRRYLASAYQRIYRQQIDNGDILRSHPGVEKFTLQRIRPQLHDELERRTMASINLIVLNRGEAVRQMVRRFSGWASSVPKGGSAVIDRRKESKNIRRSMAGLPFEERRVLVDQGHKFTAALSEILATDSGALGAVWHSNWRQSNYDYREDHKDRDGRFYTMRDNWALKKGLMKKSPAGYTDEITKPGEEVFCRCRYRWVYNLRSIPSDLLTQKGKDALNEIRTRRAA